jgi:hypothetical protein
VQEENSRGERQSSPLDGKFGISAPQITLPKGGGARGTPPAKIMAANAYLFSSSPLSSANLALQHGTDEFSFADGQPAGTMKSFVANDVGQMSNWQLNITDVDSQLDQLWLVVRYTLG